MGKVERPQRAVVYRPVNQGGFGNDPYWSILSFLVSLPHIQKFNRSRKPRMFSSSILDVTCSSPYHSTVRLSTQHPAFCKKNCQFCKKDPETDEHLMIHCHLRQPLWSWLEETARLLGCRTNPDEIIRGHIGPTENLRTIFR